MSDTEMVERVARAIGDVERQFKHTYSWERADEDWRDLCRERARAAIAAMREPTPGMVEKAMRIIRPNVCATDPCDGPEVDDCACRKKATDVLNAVVADIAAAEREACARIVDNHNVGDWNNVTIARAIRARRTP